MSLHVSVVVVTNKGVARTRETHKEERARPPPRKKKPTRTPFRLWLFLLLFYELHLVFIMAGVVELNVGLVTAESVLFLASSLWTLHRYYW